MEQERERLLMLSAGELRELDMYLSFCGLNANWKWPGKWLESAREKIKAETMRLSKEEARNLEIVRLGMGHVVSTGSQVAGGDQ